MPASRAFATIRVEVASSVGPPNIMVPRQIGEIFRPLRPRERYCMGWCPSSLKSFRGDAKHRTRNLEIPGSLVSLAPRNDGQYYASFFNILNTPLAIAIQRFSAVTSAVTKKRLRVERTTRRFDSRIST